MKNRSILAPTLGAIAVLIACTACAPDDPSGTPTATPTETPAATPSPAPSGTATAEPLDLDEPASWTIDFSGVGPLTLGGSISAERVDMTAFSDDSQPEACALVVFSALAEDVPDIWAQPGTDPDVSDVLVVTGNGEPAPFVIGSPTTATGIGIGATEGELLEAYPEIASKPGPNPESLTYSVTDGAGGYINFAVDPSKLVESIAISDQSVIPYEYCG
jgi:hypothetical protein